MDNVSSKRRFFPLIVALFAQVAAAFIIIAIAWWLRIGLDEIVILLFAQGVTAALFGWFLKLEPWWLPIQLFLPLALLPGLSLTLPSWVYLAAFFIILLVYWNSASQRVPLYLSNRTTWDVLSGLVGEKTDVSFIDLGSGLGGVPISLASKHPQGCFFGVESAPVPFGLSWLRLKFFGPSNTHIIYGDYWNCDLSQYDVVYCFLSPAPMPELYKKARLEMRPGSILISNSFDVPGYPADEIICVDDGRKTMLHIWRM